METFSNIILLLSIIWTFLNNQQQDSRLYYMNVMNNINDDDEEIWNMLRARRVTRRRMLSAALIATTSDDNGRPRRRAWRPRPRPNIVSLDWWNETVCQRYTEQLWKENFRMSKDTFHVLCDILRPTLQRGASNFGNGLSVEKVVGMTLWRLATCCDLRTIGNLFGVHRSTVCRSVQEVCQAIVDTMYKNYIVWPTGEELTKTVNGFEELGFPQCAGAIHGSHIPIKAPHFSPLDYYNRMGWYSMILQAVVDNKLRFTDVNVGWPGKVHDARVFRNSRLYENGQNGRLFPRSDVQMDGVDVPIFIIGNPAYPLLPWLMKAFPEQGDFNRRRSVYNYRLSRARLVVERAFGNLKGRWRMLMHRNDTHISKIPLIVSTCCVLHNFCIEQNDEVEAMPDLPEVEVDDNHAPENPLPGAMDIRTAVMNYCNMHP